MFLFCGIFYLIHRYLEAEVFSNSPLSVIWCEQRAAYFSPVTQLEGSNVNVNVAILYVGLADMMFIILNIKNNNGY
jgi:hypothetical protein